MGTEVHKKALIIGISEYDNPRRLPNLDFCKDDACKIYQLLSSPECGYEIPDNRKLIGRIKYMDVRKSLYDFFNPKNSGPDDTLILYFSGHGLIDDSSNHYISTSETDPDNPGEFSFSLQDLASMMEPLNFVKIVIILDCCYGADPSISNKVNNARSARDIILNTKINLHKGKYIFSACDAYQKSAGSNEGGSIFTNNLCKGLMGADGKSVDSDGNVTLYELEQYIAKKIMSLKPRLRQTPLIAKIPSSDNDNNGMDVVLARTQYIKPVLSSSEDLKQVESDKELLDYYRIDQRIINIRQSELSDLKQRIQEWGTSTIKANKPILIITGGPGTGKSWLAYRLIASLKADGHKVYGIVGSDIKRDIIYNDNRKDIKEKNKKCPLYILDDRGISVGEVSTAVNTQKIYEILQSFLPTNFKETYKGPIIISIRKETWDYIINGGDTGEPLNESRFDEIVDKVILESLQLTEGEKLVRSFYEEVDEKKPPYPNLVVNQEVKNMIIKRSNCNPIIIRLFFHEMYSRGNNYEITISDVEGIISSARHYCLKLVFNFYLNNLVDKEKVANILAFLYLLAKEGAISLGHMMQIKENENYIPRNYLSRDIWKYLNLLNEKRLLPLFNIDDYGIMMPFHDSVSDAIINLVVRPGILKKEILSKIEEEKVREEDLNDILNKVTTIINVDRDIRVKRSGIQYRGGIKEKAETELLDKYDDSIKDSMVYYFDSWKIEMENYESISDDTAYSLLSLIIEVLNPKKKFKFDSHEYINKLKHSLEKARLEYGNAANDIIKQLFWIMENQYWFYSPKDSFKDIYLRMLSVPDESIRSTTWEITNKLVGINIVSILEVKSLIVHFFSLLKSRDHKIRGYAWDRVSKLIEAGIITSNDQDMFLELLSEPDEKLRLNAWKSLDLPLFSLKIVNRESLIQRGIMEHLFSLLRSSNEGMREGAWFLISPLNWVRFSHDLPFAFANNLIKYGIITSEDQDIFLKLLSDPDERIRKDAWINVAYLIEKKILSFEEVMKLKQKQLFSLLESSDYYVRWEVCMAIDTMTDGIITQEEKSLVKGPFLSLLNSQDEEIRLRFWGHFNRLVKSKILSFEDIAPYKEQLFANIAHNLRTSDDKIRRSNIRLQLSKLIEDGIIDIEDFKNLLSSPDEILRLTTWRCIVDLYTRKIVVSTIIPIEELKKVKDYLLTLLKNRNKDFILNLFEIESGVSIYIRGYKLSTMSILMELGVITRDDRDTFLKLLCDEDEDIRWHSWTNVPYLIKNNIIPIEELKKVKDYLLTLLKGFIKRGLAEMWKVSHIEEIDKLINLDPIIIFRYYVMVDSFALYQKYSYENNNVEEIPDQDLCNSKPWKDKGWHFYGLAKYDEAKKYFDKATQLDSSDVDAWKGRISNCFAMGRSRSSYRKSTNDFLDSLSFIGEAIKLDPNNSKLIGMKAQVLVGLGKYDEAVKYFDKALQLDLNNTDYLINKAYTLINLAKYEESLNLFSHIIDLGYNDSYVWRGKILSLIGLKMYNDALIGLNEAIKLDPNNSKLIGMKAQVLVYLDKDDEAIEFFNKALKMDSHNAHAWYNRACFNIRKGDIERGLSDLAASIDEGGNYYQQLAMKDEAFTSIRNSQRFRVLLRERVVTFRW